MNARRAFPTRTGDLRPAAPSTATARELAKTLRARSLPRPPDAASRVAAPKGTKFCCLQRIEKAENVKIFSAAEERAGAISQTAEALRSSRYFHPPRSGASFDREAGDRDLT
jgi:hypothetical protein